MTLTPGEAAEQVREALGPVWGEDEHHSRCPSRSGEDCTCPARSYHEAVAALDVLVEALTDEGAR